MKAKLVLGVVVGLIIAGIAGWLWGAAGRSDATRALQISELRAELFEARASMLDARLAIYSVNFGQASQHLEDARALLGRAAEQLKSRGGDAEVEQVQMALLVIADAQRMAGKLDQNANSRSGEAAKIIADVIDAVAKR